MSDSILIQAGLYAGTVVERDRLSDRAAALADFLSVSRLEYPILGPAVPLGDSGIPAHVEINWRDRGTEHSTVETWLEYWSIKVYVDPTLGAH